MWPEDRGILGQWCSKELEALKQLLVIPRTPEPEGPPRPRGANTSTVILDLDPMEMEEVQRLLAEMKVRSNVACWLIFAD